MLCPRHLDNSPPYKLDSFHHTWIPQKASQKMSKYQPPVYQIPSQPSDKLKVVLDYFDCLKTWDLEALSQLSTPGFTQATLPASLGLPVRSKSEDIEFLHGFRDSLKGAPLEVRIIYGHFLP